MPGWNDGKGCRKAGERKRGGHPGVFDCAGKSVVRAVCPRRGELKISERRTLGTVARKG